MTMIALPLDLVIDLKDLLLLADTKGSFGKCKDHPHPSGKGCVVCTTLQDLEIAIDAATTPIPE